MSNFIRDMQEELKRENLFLFLKKNLKLWIFLLGTILFGISAYLWFENKKKAFDEKGMIFFKEHQSTFDKNRKNILQQYLLSRKDGLSMMILMDANVENFEKMGSATKEQKKKLLQDVLTNNEKIQKTQLRDDLGLKMFLQGALIFQKIHHDIFEEKDLENIAILENPHPLVSPWGVLSEISKALVMGDKKKPEMLTQALDNQNISYISPEERKLLRLLIAGAKKS